MSDDTTQTGATSGDPTTGVRIPADTQARFPDITDLIRRSESMNDEERQYWVDILPVMTPEQVEQLRGILQNERDQLAAIDAKYAKQIGSMGDRTVLHRQEEERRARQEERTKAEEAAQERAAQRAEDILNEMD